MNRIRSYATTADAETARTVREALDAHQKWQESEKNTYEEALKEMAPPASFREATRATLAFLPRGEYSDAELEL